MSKQKKITYKSSGVDVNLGYKLVDIIKPFAKKTLRKEIDSNIGSFAALASIPKNYKSPKLVACTDGVGTKISIAEKLNDHSTVGEDLVAMCVNDLITVGAEPLFFLDYLVTDKINLRKKKQIFKGISKGCLAAGCSLIGGETAEHPDEFPKGKYDLAGFSVGVAEKNKILKINNVKMSDVELAQIISVLTINDIIKLKEMYLNNYKVKQFYYYISTLKCDLDYNKYFESIIYHYNHIYNQNLTR